LHCVPVTGFVPREVSLALQTESAGHVDCEMAGVLEAGWEAEARFSFKEYVA